ncbi:hypothetical protein ACFQYP_23090 [Nonomuraea antimicrobica]
MWRAAGVGRATGRRDARRDVHGRPVHRTGHLAATPADTPAPDTAETPDTADTPGPGTPAPDSPYPTETLIAGHYQPLWPFSGPDDVAAWQRAHQKDGRDAWHLDPARTAIAFTRDYLGFEGIDRAVKTVRAGDHARVHVGYRSPEGSERSVAAVVHLMRYGTGVRAPGRWSAPTTPRSPSPDPRTGPPPAPR